MIDISFTTAHVHGAAELAQTDNLHLDAATHRLIGERSTTYAFGPRSPFAQRLSALDASATPDGAPRSGQAARVTSAKETDV